MDYEQRMCGGAGTLSVEEFVPKPNLRLNQGGVMRRVMGLEQQMKASVGDRGEDSSKPDIEAVFEAQIRAKQQMGLW